MKNSERQETRSRNQFIEQQKYTYIVNKYEPMFVYEIEALTDENIKFHEPFVESYTHTYTYTYASMIFVTILENIAAC